MGYKVALRSGEYILLQDGRRVPTEYISEQAAVCLDKLNKLGDTKPRVKPEKVEVVKPC